MFANARPHLVTAIRWLAVLTPLAMVGGPSPADIACTFVAVAFLVCSTVSRDFSWVRQDWVLAALALWAYLLLRSLWGEAGHKGIGLALIFVRFPLFAVALQSFVLRDAIWRKRLAVVGVVALGALALDGLLQYFWGRDVLGHPMVWGLRITAFYNHPWVGAMLSWLFIPVALSLLDQKRPIGAGIFGVVCMATIILSGDRMALLAAFLALVILGLLFKRSRRVFFIALPVALAGLIAIVVLNPKVYERQVESTISVIRNFGDSHYAEIWSSTLRIIADRPIFGTGRGGYREVCRDPKYGPLYERSPSEPRCATHTHNIYLEWLVETGIVGFCLFLLMIGTILRRFIRGFGQPGLDWAYSGAFVTLLARLWPLASWTSFHQAWSAVPLWLVIGWGLAYLPLAAGSAPKHLIKAE